MVEWRGTGIQEGQRVGVEWDGQGETLDVSRGCADLHEDKRRRDT